MRADTFLTEFLNTTIGPTIPEIRLFQNFDIEKSRSTLWLWSKGKVK